MKRSRAPQVSYIPGTDIPKVPGLDEAYALLDRHAQEAGEGHVDDALCLVGFHWWTRVRWWPPRERYSWDHLAPCPTHCIPREPIGPDVVDRTTYDAIPGIGLVPIGRAGEPT